MTYWHEFNPWANRIVYVPNLLELAKACASWAPITMPDGDTEIMTAEWLVNHWQEECGDKLDGYVLPHGNGRHSIGVRYGESPEDYLSPFVHNQVIAAWLVKTYQR